MRKFVFGSLFKGGFSNERSLVLYWNLVLCPCLHGVLLLGEEGLEKLDVLKDCWKVLTGNFQLFDKLFELVLHVNVVIFVFY